LAGCGSPRLSNGWMTATRGLSYLEQRVWHARTLHSLRQSDC
jgi:hypothetical protein